MGLCSKAAGKGSLGPSGPVKPEITNLEIVVRSLKNLHWKVR